MVMDGATGIDVAMAIGAVAANGGAMGEAMGIGGVMGMDVTAVINHGDG